MCRDNGASILPSRVSGRVADRTPFRRFGQGEGQYSSAVFALPWFVLLNGERTSTLPLMREGKFLLADRRSWLRPGNFCDFANSLKGLPFARESREENLSWRLTTQRGRAMQPFQRLSVCASVLTVLITSAFAEEIPAIGLLTQETAQIVEQSSLDLPRSQLAVLSDGTTDRLVPLNLQPAVAFDLTWRLPDVATCEELIVSADSSRLTGQQLPRVEVLASTLSAQSGFQTVRSFALKATRGPQKFKLPGNAAQWIIIRLISPAEETVLPVSEVEILGHVGPPQSRYAFKEAPANAFKVLSEVKQSIRISVSDDETSLFKDAADGKLDDWSFAEAALLTSGVLESEQRKLLLQKIEKIVKQADAAVAEATSPWDKGDRLLKWLHENTMSAGYEENQTDLVTILKTGHFNCVSSATLYNIVGRRLGLDVRAIEVPDHAFSILYVGANHADIETTNALGFNPARDRRFQDQFSEQTGFRYIPERHADQRREVTDTGLLALTCYNHGVFHTQNREYAQALGDYFRALSLDSESASAIQNVLAVFANWSKELSENLKFSEAVDVVTAGLRLAPEDRNLLHNRKVVWQNWARAEIEGNRRDSALGILRRAAKEVPDGGFEKMQAFVFIQPGENFAESGQWEAALKLADDGLQVVTEVAQVELRDWRKSVYHRWTDSALKKLDFAAAADVLDQARKVEPEDWKFIGNTAYVVQEWLRHSFETDGLTDTEVLLKKLSARFKDVGNTQRILESFVSRTADSMIEKKDVEGALALIGRQSELLSDDATRDLRRSVFDGQSSALADMKRWEDAVAVYLRGLELMPGDSHLRNNLMATWDIWAREFRDAGKWEQAADVYAKGLDSGIDNSTFARKIGYCLQELSLSALKAGQSKTAEKQLAAWIKNRPEIGEIKTAARAYVQTLAEQHQKKDEHQQALAAIDRCRVLLDESSHQRQIRYACDTWARSHVQAKDWTAAIEAYSHGMKYLPEDGHLTRNAAATWNQWAGTFIDGKKWADAIRVYEQALEQFPDDGTLKNNLKYCQQQAKKAAAS